MRYYGHLLAAASLLGLATAQVHTDCNPMQNTTCPPDPAFGTDYTFYFNSTPSGDLWESLAAGSINYDNENGAAFTIAKQGDSPTLRTKFYFFFGRTEIWLKVAPGQGIVSSTMWLSDDLDEVDWEFLGSNNTLATTNYFGKGLQDYHNGAKHDMPGGVQGDFHNYTTVWTKEQIDWYIDGALIRTLTAAAANNTHNYPQTPMRLSIGIWAGGDPSLPEGTRQWAGGNTDYANGPYTMYVKSARITDFSSGSQYTYGDTSGSWESIKIAAGNSTALQSLNAQPKETLAQKWAALPQTTKIGIYSGAGGVGALMIGSLLFYCIRQRRIGAREARLADEREKAERMELEKFKRDGVDPDGFTDYGHEYDARGMSRDGTVNAASTMGPLDNEGWSGRVDSPMHSPVPLLNNDNGSPRSPTTGSFREVRNSSGPGGFDFGVPPSPVTAVPARTPSPGMMRSQSPPMSPPRVSSPRGRIGSPGPQQMTQGPQRMQSPGPLTQVRNFSASHAGYRGLPGGEV